MGCGDGERRVWYSGDCLRGRLARLSGEGLRLGGPERVSLRGERGRRRGDREREGDSSRRRGRGDVGLRAGDSGDLTRPLYIS